MRFFKKPKTWNDLFRYKYKTAPVSHEVQENINIFEKKYLHWDREGRMIRPSHEDIKIYNEFIGPVSKNKKILILGPTTELRDLIAGHKATVVVADISFKSIIRASKFLTKARTEDEIWIKSNWVDLPFGNGYFDVILGDCVVNQFSPGSEETRFLEIISKLCAPNGHLISRFIIQSPRLMPVSLGDAAAFLSKTAYLQKREKASMLANAALVYTSDGASRRYNIDLAQIALENLLREQGFRFQERSIVRGALRYLKESGLTSGQWWAPPLEKELIHLLEIRYTIVHKKHARDYPAAYCFPIMDCIPKQK